MEEKGAGQASADEAEHREMMQTTSSVLPASERRACAAVNEGNLTAVLHTFCFLAPGSPHSWAQTGMSVVSVELCGRVSISPCPHFQDCLV